MKKTQLEHLIEALENCSNEVANGLRLIGKCCADLTDDDIPEVAKGVYLSVEHADACYDIGACNTPHSEHADAKKHMSYANRYDICYRKVFKYVQNYFSTTTPPEPDLKKLTSVQVADIRKSSGAIYKKGIKDIGLMKGFLTYPKLIYAGVTSRFDIFFVDPASFVSKANPAEILVGIVDGVDYSELLELFSATIDDKEEILNIFPNMGTEDLLKMVYILLAGHMREEHKAELVKWILLLISSYHNAPRRRKLSQAALISVIALAPELYLSVGNSDDSEDQYVRKAASFLLQNPGSAEEAVALITKRLKI